MISYRRRERHDAQRSLVGFLLADTAYAIPIAGVREIINPIPLSGFPRAPEEVAGVADHRGDVVTVIDLRKFFGVASDDTLSRVKWILIEGGEGACVGLVVDQVTDVFGIDEFGLKPAPDVRGAEARGVVGVTTHDERLTFVLDPDRFRRLVASVVSSPPAQATRRTQ